MERWRVPIMRLLSRACVQTDIENQKRGCWLPFPVCSFHCEDEWLQNQNLAESIMLHRIIHLWLIIFDWASSRLSHSLLAQLSAHKKPEVRIVSEQSGTSAQFPQMASFPKLPSSRPLASSGDTESIIRCVWAAPISTTPVGGADIEWPFLHGSLILTPSPHLITMGTFHRVLDKINDFFLRSHLSSPFAIFLPHFLLPCIPRLRCSWADNPTSPGARPP